MTEQPRETRFTQSVGDGGRWVQQYFDPQIGRWFDIGDSYPTEQDARDAAARRSTLEYLRDFDPQTYDEIPVGQPFCYMVDATMETTGGYIPALVFQDVSGYFPLKGRDGGRAWVWGPTLDDARQAVAEANAALGLDAEQALQIRLSSFQQARAQGKLGD